MKNIKRWIAFLLSLLIILSSYVPVVAETSEYPSAYSSEYNSGERGEVCTTLDGTSAYEYYTGNYTYEYWETLSSSALETSLHNLMTNTHKYISSYDDCHYKANRTDCENEEGNVILIYTSYSATMNQWNGWNREHVWPQSLGGDNTRGGGADMHHIRPSDAGVNSSRGNKKYGNVDGGTAKDGSDPAVGVLGGHYDSTYFEPLDNVKGDVARIILYVWVRWGSDWGATDVTKVFQSVDVLLEWCALDPVDTWEMGRNEVVQDIQGNRNVFIDYPELAWLIFDKADEMPDDMTTPSGIASGANLGDPDCAHTDTGLKNQQNATCTTNGYTGNTYCLDCGYVTARGSVIPATNHPNAYIKNEASADCTNAGYTGDKYCPDCGKNIETGKTIPATNHPNAYLQNAVSEDCNNAGYTGDKYCPDCGKIVKNGTTIPALNHINTEIKNSVQETCADDGYTGDTYCKDCGEKTADGQTIPKNNDHSFGEWTLSSDGVTYKRCCGVCGAEEIYTMDMLIAELGTDAERIVVLLALGANSSLIIDALAN